MTTIETRITKIKEGKGYGKLEVTENDILERNGEIEVVREVSRENGRLVGFKTVRREGEGIILETGYCIYPENILKINFSGIYHSEDTDHFSKSDRYFELNDFLQGLER